MQADVCSVHLSSLKVDHMHVLVAIRHSEKSATRVRTELIYVRGASRISFHCRGRPIETVMQLLDP